MPIFEFKCNECGHLQEIIITSSSKEELDLKCEKCGSHELQRVISTTSYIMGSSGERVKTTTKQCGPGNSCTTYEIPGYSK